MAVILASDKHLDATQVCVCVSLAAEVLGSLSDWAVVTVSPPACTSRRCRAAVECHSQTNEASMETPGHFPASH
jgi:hypothetical protein